MTKFAATILLLILVSSVSLAGDNSSRLVNDSCFAPSLKKPVHFEVLLPPGYTTSRHYPILYLLHGWNGNYRNWIELTRATAYTASSEWIVVTPDGANSWYVNSLTEPLDRYEDFIASDLPHYIQKRYMVDTTWQAIAGLSMGGYGALQIGLRHYRQYKFIGVLSGGLDVPGEIDSMEQRGRGTLLPSVVAAFGAHHSPFRDEHDPFRIFRKVPPDSCPTIYLVTGIQEVFKGRLLIHRRFADSLRVHSLPYEYHETPGGHNFEFWDRELEPMLKRLETMYSAAKPPLHRK